MKDSKIDTVLDEHLNDYNVTIESKQTESLLGCDFSARLLEKFEEFELEDIMDDAKEIMLDLLDSGFAQDINVYIGSENSAKELKDFSIVTFKHKIGNKDMGTIGIIGPTRMDYSKVISVLKYISKKLNNKN